MSSIILGNNICCGCHRVIGMGARLCDSCFGQERRMHHQVRLTVNPTLAPIPYHVAPTPTQQLNLNCYTPQDDRISFFDIRLRYYEFANSYPETFYVKTVRFLSADHMFTYLKHQNRHVRNQLLTMGCSKSLHALSKSYHHDRHPAWFQPILPGIILPVISGYTGPYQLRMLVMLYVLINKFQITMLAQKLVSTQHKILINANHHDEFWGKGKGHGLNMLGRLLMIVRDLLQNGRLHTLNCDISCYLLHQYGISI